MLGMVHGHAHGADAMWLLAPGLDVWPRILSNSFDLLPKSSLLPRHHVLQGAPRLHLDAFVLGLDALCVLHAQQWFCIINIAGTVVLLAASARGLKAEQYPHTSCT
jgi:hypothetical protein